MQHARLTISWLRSLSPAQQAKFLSALSDVERAALFYRWVFWAREPQLAPTGDWRTWLVLAGRGFGKTRCGAEWVREQVETGRCRRVALVAATAADARDVMVEGESGILAICPPWNRPKYEPSKRRLTWPNGAIATTYSADEPKRLRGPQHDGAWADELCAWRYLETWDMLMFGLRLGRDPRVVVTTTPKPIAALRKLLGAQTTMLTKGSTYDNAANLAPAFMTDIIAAYEGTRLGRQELNAELLEDNPAALWKRVAMLDAYRVARVPELKRIVVGVDPSASGHGDECGIIVAGLGADGHGYVIDDRSRQGSPNEWATAAVAAYNVHKANYLVAEVNQGGEMVETVLRTVDRERQVTYKAVHASRGKYTRAEPIAALYEQGKVHHVGSFAYLEDQLCQWTPGDDSPDRLDALVWALSELMLKPVRKLTAA
jgi:predicted phage terminase large subunit-like protein